MKIMEKLQFQFFVILLYLIFSVQCGHFGDMTNLAHYMNRETLCKFDVSFAGKRVSRECIQQLTESCENEEALAKMIDASSKFPYTGLATSTATDYGDYDECMEVDHKYHGGRILGKYCLFGLYLNISMSKGFYLLSVCMPDTCTDSDYDILFQNASKEINPEIQNFTGKFNNQRCSTKEYGTDLTVLDIVTISLFALCFALMVVCTIYDLYLKHHGKKTDHPLYLAFSVYSNGKKLFQTAKNGGKDQILIFHGLKIVSMLWIIAGHGASIWQLSSLVNQTEHDELQNSMSILYLSSAVLAVDTFFYLGGFLAGWGYMKKKSLSLKGHILSTPQSYIHRYLRITPALITILLVQLSIFGHFGSGPLWHYLYEEIQGKCERNWWATLLYIQNYHNKDDVCMVQSWYLSADMQMFWLSPIILIPLAIALKNPRRLKICMLAMCVLNILLTALPIAIKLGNEDYQNGFDTHSRLNTYFIGIMMGVFLHETKDRPFLTNKWSKEKISLYNIVMWICSLLVLLIVVITQRTTEIDGRYESLVYQDAIKRPFWAAGLSWIIYSSYHGYGGFINWILTRPLMQIGGKLSYCIYLVHGLVIIYKVMVTRTKVYMSHYNWFYYWCGHFILSTVIAFIWTLAFESPLIIIEKFIFGGGSRSQKPRNQQPQPTKEGSNQNGTIPVEKSNIAEENKKNVDLAIIAKPEILE